MDRAQRLIILGFCLFLAFFAFPCFAKSCLTVDEKCTQGEAYQAASSQLSSFGANACSSYLSYLTNGEGTVFGYSNYYQAQLKCLNNGEYFWLKTGSNRYWTDSCSSLPSESWSSLSPDIAAMDGAISCRHGCTALNTKLDSGDNNGRAYFSSDFLNGTCDNFPQNCAQYGSGWYFSYVFLACMPPEPQCPDGQSRGTNGKCKEACPAGMVEQANGTCKPKNNECPAGQTKAPDGSCIDNQCPAGQTKGPDGTCKPDKDDDDDDGEGDNCPAGQKADANGKCQYDESFSGGDDCSAPPTCSGSPILCGQARIQWRIDCNTRRNTNVSGGTCASVPVCTGEKCDAVEYAQLIQQWKTACALEKLAAGGTTQPGDTSGQPDWTKVTGMSQDPGAGASADDTKVLTDKSLSPDDLDQGGFGGGSCMGFVTGSVGGDLANGFAADLLNPPAFWCNYVADIKAVMILLGAVAAAYILSRPT